MNTFPLILLALGVLAIGYRYYSKFIAMTVLGVDETRTTPAHTQYDGQNYYPMSKWVLFGHHFAGITGAGPLIGPVLAAQFGFLPGLIWLVLVWCWLEQSRISSSCSRRSVEAANHWRKSRAGKSVDSR